MSLCVAGGVLSGALVFAQGLRPRLPEAVPGFVADALRLSVADFAFALAEAHVSAGFIAFEHEFHDEPSSSPIHAAWNYVALHPPHAAPVPLADLIQAFATRYRAYAIERRGQVLLIRAKAIGTVRWLDSDRVPHFSVHDAFVTNAFNEAQRLVEPSIPSVTGVMGSSMNETPPVFEQIQVDMADATVLEVLNGVAGAAPGSIWILTRHRDDGEYYRLSVRLPGGLECHFPDRLHRQPKR